MTTRVVVKLVVGLGNPGERYRGTRHNVGFLVIDELARRHMVTEAVKTPADAEVVRWRRVEEPVLLARPQTFMNLSGHAVQTLSHFFKIELPDLLIVCDDVNLPLGKLRVRAAGSEGGHNGLRSVADVLGTIEYARLRVGVGRGDARRDLADHVTAEFEPEERPGIDAAIARAADAVETWISDGLAKMMNLFNRGEE
ncbi:MAG TPA: aminoacyl-tRNA hydrolase [Vicinamibacterales bacterium]